jgi:hypothetical protein
MLDWFFNIGDIIAMSTIDGQLTPLGSWVTEEHRFTYDLSYTIHRSNWNPEYTVTYEGDTGSLMGSYVVKRRIADPSKSIIPSVRINLSWAKLLDIASIARGFMKSMMKT